MKAIFTLFHLILCFTFTAQKALESCDLNSNLEFFKSNTGNIGIRTKEGKEKLAAKFQTILPYSNGYLVVKKNKSQQGELTYSSGFYSYSFQEILSISYVNILPLDNSTFIVSRNKDEKYGLVDLKNNLLFPYEYEYISAPSEGFYCAKKNGKYGYLNKSGDVKIDFIYTFALPFSEEKAAVSSEELVGFIDKKGKNVISAKFSTSNSFYNNSAEVFINNLSSTIDSVGQLRFPFVFSAIEIIENAQFVFETHPIYRGDFQKEIRTKSHSLKLNQWAPIVEYSNTDDEGITPQTNQFKFKGVVNKSKEIIGGEDFVEVIYLGQLNKLNYFAVQSLTEVEENDNWYFALMNETGQIVGTFNHLEIRFNAITNQLEELLIENGEVLWRELKL